MHMKLTHLFFFLSMYVCMLMFSSVTTGIFIATYHEVELVLIGFIYQAASMICEAFRLQLIQILMQGKKMNPIQTLFYLSPACFLCLLIPFSLFEAQSILMSDEWKMEWYVLLANCSVALGLNIAVFLLIGKTSALTMNIAGVVKDWGLIVASFILFQSPIVIRQVEGYGIAFTGVMGYNYMKMKQKKEEEQEQQRQENGKTKGFDNPSNKGELLRVALHPAGPNSNDDDNNILSDAEDNDDLEHGK